MTTATGREVEEEMRDAGAAGAHEMSWTFPFSRVAAVAVVVYWGPFRQFSPSFLLSFFPSSVLPSSSRVSCLVDTDFCFLARRSKFHFRGTERERGEREKGTETETDRVGE